MKIKEIKKSFFLLVCFSFFCLNINGASNLKDLNPPNPKKIPITFKAHGVERIDNYYWMRDDSRKDLEIINHLKEENNYLEDWFSKGIDKRLSLIHI